MVRKTALQAFLVLLISIFSQSVFAQPGKTAIIAYYAGPANDVANFQAEKLTHIIYSFCHLKGNKLNVDDAGDSATIVEMVKLKQRNPKLKVMLSLGGWGGCRNCSPIFAVDSNRKAFARSVKHLNDYFKTDGIDLDWEYPTIPGHPGHPYMEADRENFTALVKDLRAALGKKHEISFAAGGFMKFLELSVDWKAVMPVVDRVNIMTYDLVNGYDTVTGHHTPLYSGNPKMESTDRAVQYLLNLGIPAKKLVIGGAFYARVWENVAPVNNGLFQIGKFKRGISYRHFETELSAANGFVEYWDSTASAPYRYSESKRLYATYDDKRSIAAKTKYAIDKKLNGIMFWQLREDLYKDGLLDEIYSTVQSSR